MVSTVFGKDISQYREVTQKVEDVELVKQELTQEIVQKAIPRTVVAGPGFPRSSGIASLESSQCTLE